MKLDERELRTLDRLVKNEANDNQYNIDELERHNPDFVALYQTPVYQWRLSERDHLAELACKITGDLMGVMVEIKLKR